MPRSKRNPKFGERLATAMQVGQITVRDTDLAKAVDVAPQRIQAFLRGSYPENDDYYLVPLLAHVLEVRVDWLVGDDVEMREFPDRIPLFPIELVDISLYNPVDYEAGPLATRPKAGEMRIEKVGSGEHWGFNARSKDLSPMIAPGDHMVYTKLDHDLTEGDVIYCRIHGRDTFGVLRKVRGRYFADTFFGRVNPPEIDLTDVIGICVITERVGASASTNRQTHPFGLNADVFSQKV